LVITVNFGDSNDSKETVTTGTYSNMCF